MIMVNNYLLTSRTECRWDLHFYDTKESYPRFMFIFVEFKEVIWKKYIDCLFLMIQKIKFVQLLLFTIIIFILKQEQVLTNKLQYFLLLGIKMRRIHKLRIVYNPKKVIIAEFAYIETFYFSKGRLSCKQVTTHFMIRKMKWK